eukprot:scaffold25495_cov121-Isochrysis_galbana.AAC.11
MASARAPFRVSSPHTLRFRARAATAKIAPTFTTSTPRTPPEQYPPPSPQYTHPSSTPPLASRRDRRACGKHAVHLQRHLVALVLEGNAGVVAGRVRGSDAGARHAESPSSDAVPSYFGTF